MGGGKAVILADEDRTKTPAMLAAFGDAVERLGGRYVTAEDVGISVADMQAVYSKAADAKLQVVREKYSSAKFYSVSSLGTVRPRDDHAAIFC